MSMYAKCRTCERVVPLEQCSVEIDSGRHYCDDCLAGQSVRPSWDEICMNIALDLALRSTCRTPDRQVGCVIVSEDYSNVLSWGYNGGPSKSDEPCDFDPTVERGSRCNCVHAEMNALTKLDSHGKQGLRMYVTLSPCKLCATLIVNAKCIDEVVYLKEYRDPSPLFTLGSAGIKVRSLSGDTEDQRREFRRPSTPFDR